MTHRELRHGSELPRSWNPSVSNYLRSTTLVLPESSLRSEKNRVLLRGFLSAPVRPPTLTKAPAASNANHRGPLIPAPDRRLSCARQY